MLAMQSVLEPAVNSLASPGRGSSEVEQILTNALMLLVFAAVGLPGAIGFPGCYPGSLFICKIARLLFHSFRKDVVGPFLESL
jgi:hypothetical protein